MFYLEGNIEQMSFFKNLKSSIYNPQFYSKIKNQSLGSALKYFFLLILTLCIINTVILSFELAVNIPSHVKDFVTQTVSSFPSDLEVSIDEGQVTTNAPEPFLVPFPEFDEEIEQNNLNNLLVIDTKTPYSSQQFNQYKTLTWLTKDTLVYESSTNRRDIRVLDLTQIENFTINKDFVQYWVSKISPWLNLIGPILIFAVLIGLFLGFTFKLIYFFFLAVLIFFLASIFKWGLNYSASYKTAIYASTLSLIVDFILFNTGLYTGFYGFPFLFTLISLCIATINLQNFERKE